MPHNKTVHLSRFYPRGWSIRLVTSVVAALVVMIVVAAAGVGTLIVLRASVHRAQDSTDLNRASDIVSALSVRGPAAAADLVNEPASGVDLARVVRILPTGQLSGPSTRPGSSTDLATPSVAEVLASRPNRDTAMFDSIPAPAVGQTAVRTVYSSTGTEYRITTVSVMVGGERYLVYVGSDSRRYDIVLKAVAVLLAIFVPLAGLVSAALIFAAMGRVLRPMEAIRAQVSEISSSDLHERVLVPQSEDEIAELARTMNEMLARLESAQTAQVAFVGDASHELRSPLSTLSTMLELSSTSGRPVDVETVDELLLPEVARMRSMVEDLLLLAKSDERGVPLRRDDVDLDDIVLAEATRLRGTSDERLKITVSVEPARLVGDHDSLVRVVRNLADNARRHARSTVSLQLAVDRSVPTAPQAIVLVDDDGDGVPEAQRAHIFDRFARLDADRGRDTGGSGLGLAIVANIIKVHGGQVDVEEAPGGGARFRVELPVESLADLED